MLHNRVLLIGLLVVMCMSAVTTANPINDAFNDINYAPDAGYYTGRWFGSGEDTFVSVQGLFGSILAPFEELLGSWTFVIIWGTLIMGIYLHTRESTLPFVVGILSGSILAYLMGESGIMIMYLTLGFAGAGILAKALLGKR